MKKFIVIFVLFSVACGGLRHGLVVSSGTAHSVLSTIQDTVNATTCDVAPTLQHCITPDQRKVIAGKLSDGFQLDIDITKTIREWDGKTPQPSNLTPLLINLATIVNDVVALIPASPQKNVLQAKLGVTK